MYYDIQGSTSVLNPTRHLLTVFGQIFGLKYQVFGLKSLKYPVFGLKCLNLTRHLRVKTIKITTLVINMCSTQDAGTIAIPVQVLLTINTVKVLCSCNCALHVRTWMAKANFPPPAFKNY